jgi:hypothetical protein
MRTLEEVKEYLIDNVEETCLLEILNITSKDIVGMFSDRIEERYTQILKEHGL